MKMTQNEEEEEEERNGEAHVKVPRLKENLQRSDGQVILVLCYMIEQRTLLC